jgi:hypothetical protein
VGNVETGRLENKTVIPNVLLLKARDNLHSKAVMLKIVKRGSAEQTGQKITTKKKAVIKEFIMADIKVTDSHLTFLGKSYFRGGAPEVEIGSYGEKKAPITKVNYIEVQGRVPASRLKIKECVTVDSDYAATTEVDLLANISLIGVFKGSAFAYGLVKIQWDANQKKNKTKIVKLTDDQWSLS